MQEIWKDIEGYEGCYQVSNLGRLKSLERTVKGNNGGVYVKKEKILTPTINSSGYYHTCLRKDGRSVAVYIHRIVAQAFLPNPDNLPLINHKDEDKTNNRVENLEWCSAKYNTNYGSANDRRCESLKKRNNNYNIGIPKVRRKVLCLETGIIYNSLKSVNTQLGLHHHRISQCCKGIRNTCGGYHWRFI